MQIYLFISFICFIYLFVYLCGVIIYYSTHKHTQQMTNLELQEPDVKVLYHGTAALSDAETLGLIMAGVNPTDKAKELLKAVNYDFVEIGQYNYDALKSMFNLSHLQAIRLIAVFEFARRKRIQDRPDKAVIKCSKDVFDIVAPFLSDLDHERFMVLYLNRANKVIKYETLSVGGLNGTVTDVRLILNHALLCKANGVIVSHNHPSGNLNPSDGDIAITRKIKEAGAIMDIHLLDHIIIAGEAFYSLADNGQM